MNTQPSVPAIILSTTTGRKLKLCSDYKLWTNTPYLVPTEELWFVFSEFVEVKLPLYIDMNYMYIYAQHLTLCRPYLHIASITANASVYV